MEKLYNLFRNVEIPVVLVVSKMEDDGISVDMEFIERLDKKFKNRREEASDEMYRILDEHSNDVKYYQRLGKLDDPVNFSSPQQLAIVLYDILRVQPPKRNKDNKHPEKEESDSRPTDKAALEKLKIPFSEALLRFRHYNKLITSYTSTLPEQISKKDGKIHASFNQLGKEDNNVVTGRFSSDSPNLQQLPSKETTMRLMFVASTEYKDLSVDDSNSVSVSSFSEVEMCDGSWKNIKSVCVGDCIKSADGSILFVCSISKSNDLYNIKFK